MKKFSVVTSSKRTGWEAQAAKSIASQTIQPEQWIVVSSDFETSLRKLKATSCKTTVVQEPKPKRVCNLSASMNEGLRHVKTPYVILYQDFIDLEPDCFEKLLKLASPTTFVATLTKNTKDKLEDPRYLGVDGPRPCLPAEWETNIALAPMKAIKELGGWDEEYDDGWAWDNVNIAERADILGYEFILDESNRPQLLRHEETTKWNMEMNGERHARIMDAIYKGKRPIKCDYL